MYNLGKSTDENDTFIIYEFYSEQDICSWNFLQKYDVIISSQWGIDLTNILPGIHSNTPLISKRIIYPYIRDTVRKSHKFPFVESLDAR